MPVPIAKLLGMPEEEEEITSLPFAFRSYFLEILC